MNRMSFKITYYFIIINQFYGSSITFLASYFSDFSANAESPPDAISNLLCSSS
jgi:hypothetical protein